MPRVDWLRLAFLSLAVLLAPVPPASAAGLDSLLDAAPDPVRLRGSLIAVANRPDTSPADAAQAWRLAGASFDRGGRLDSALTCYENAARTGDDAAQAAWIEAMVARDMPGDVARAESVLAVRLDYARRTGSADLTEVLGWIAWCHHLSGRSDTARARFTGLVTELLQEERPTRWMWRYRVTAAFAPVDRERAVEYGLPLIVRSRAMDDDLVGVVRGSMGSAPRDPLAMLARTEILASDREDQAACDQLRAKRVVFPADDGFPLSAIVFLRTGTTRGRAVVALADPESNWQDYDRLAGGLRDAGYSLIVLEPRGSGRSVAPNCPSPESWRGREEELDQRVARDVKRALRVLAKETPTDTSRYLVIAGLDRAHQAAAAAQLDPRVHLVMLASPTPPEVERGRMRARLRATGVPVYIQVVTMDEGALVAGDHLFQALDGRVSRIVESRLPGSGVQVFRLDTTALPRLTTWLNENWSRTRTAAKKKSAPRPAAPRKG